MRGGSHSRKQFSGRDAPSKWLILSILTLGLDRKRKAKQGWLGKSPIPSCSVGRNNNNFQNVSAWLAYRTLIPNRKIVHYTRFPLGPTTPMNGQEPPTGQTMVKSA